ncbi:MAG: ABC transporter ATP-binding protein [Candidatus Microthrix sp.]|nr:ABC transporter ATP-binding protein [Candidatus Microthrix sp.]
MEPIIALNELTLKFGKSLALDQVSLDLPDDAGLVGLFGVNGAGKTSLLRCLAGLISSFDGRIKAPDPGSITFLPDKPFLYQFLTLRECLQLFSRLYPDFDEPLASQILSRLQLDLDKKVGECSRGMSEQLHLGLSLARRSNVYLFDEPLAAVDPLTRDALKDMIQEYRTPNSLVILSTHLIDDMDGLFDWVVILGHGRLVANQSTDSVLETGVSLEVFFKETVRALAN